MLFVGTFVICAALAYGLRKPLKRYPWVFYLAAIALDCFVLAGTTVAVPLWLRQTLMLSVSRCIPAFCLFTVAMFLGALDERNAVRKRLWPVRGELCILGGILSFGHIAREVGIYLPRLAGMHLTGPTGLLSLGLAAVAVVLLVVLTVTSFDAIRQNMPFLTWKRVQRLAYPFYVLCCLHAAIFLFVPAVRGGVSARVAVAFYLGLLVAYGVLRLRKSLRSTMAREVPGAIIEA